MKTFSVQIIFKDGQVLNTELEALNDEQVMKLIYDKYPNVKKCEIVGTYTL